MELTRKEERQVLRKAKSVRKKLKKLNRVPKNTAKVISFYNANMGLLELAKTIKNNRERNRKQKKYAKTGVCEHYVVKEKCVICKEMFWDRAK